VVFFSVNGTMAVYSCKFNYEQIPYACLSENKVMKFGGHKNKSTVDIRLHPQVLPPVNQLEYTPYRQTISWLSLTDITGM